MTNNIKLKTLSTIIMASTLFACGGGDGSNNAEGIAGKYTGKTSLADINEKNAATFSIGILGNQINFNDDIINEFTLPGMSLPIGQTTSTSESCQSAGSFTLENNLNNGLGSLSATFNNCNFEDDSDSIELNGKIEIIVNSVDSNNTPATFSFSYENLRSITKSLVSNSNSSSFSDGSYNVVQEGNNRKLTSNIDEHYIDNDTPEGHYNSSSMTRSLSIIESPNNNGIMEYSFSGNYYEANYGKVTITTITPLIFDEINSNVISGSFELTGNNNSKATLVAENYIITIHVDADGDGINESSLTLSQE